MANRSMKSCRQYAQFTGGFLGLGVEGSLETAWLGDWGSREVFNRGGLHSLQPALLGGGRDRI